MNAVARVRGSCLLPTRAYYCIYPPRRHRKRYEFNAKKFFFGPGLATAAGRLHEVDFEPSSVTLDPNHEARDARQGAKFG